MLAALDDFYRNHNANIHRGVYPLAQEADALFEGARERIAAFTGAALATRSSPPTSRRRSTSSPTRGRATNLRPGDAVLITEMEHHSNIVPWQLATEATGASCATSMSPRMARSLSSSSTRARARGRAARGAAHVSNVLGTINPIAEVVAAAHRAGALVLVDGAQAVPQMPVDVGALDADFYAWTGHKALGPTGVGVLYGRGSCSRRCRRSSPAGT